MERKISIAIPTYERFEMLFESFEKVYNDDRVSEIVIVDDASNIDLYEKIREKSFKLSKINLYRNANNRDCYTNKYTAMSFCTNDFVVLLDSDNIIDMSYIDKIFEHEWQEKRILAPTFAMPQFDYRKFSGLIIDRKNVHEYMDKPMFSTALNTCNYFVNTNQYLKSWDGEVNPVTADSIFMAYQWLNRGGEIHFVDGLEYFHRVHPGSHYQNNVSRTPTGFLEDIENKLKQMR